MTSFSINLAYNVKTKEAPEVSDYQTILSKIGKPKVKKYEIGKYRTILGIVLKTMLLIIAQLMQTIQVSL